MPGEDQANDAETSRPGVRGLTERLAALSTRNPWRVIAVWGACIVVLGILGTRLQAALDKPTELVIPGTPATKALELERSKFGRSETLVAVIRGPAPTVRQYGPKVARALKGVEHVTAVISPWSRRAPPSLMRNRHTAVFVLRVDSSFGDAGKVVGPRIRTTMGSVLPAGVDHWVVSYSMATAETVKAVFETQAKVEMVAVPLLLIVLLIVFRSPIAALLPLMLGIAVTGVSSGLLVVANLFATIDATAALAVTICGLALGVDYSLLVVSRFREELSAGLDVGRAVVRALGSAGRTIAFAGVIVASGMVIGVSILTEPILASQATAIVFASFVSVATALSLLPALLFLLGHRVNRWQIGRSQPTPRLVPLIMRIIRRPVVAMGLVLVPVLLLAIPALGLDTGPPNEGELGEDHPIAKEVRAVQESAGYGWGAPYELIATTNGKGPITTTDRLRALARAQRKVESDPAVAAVIGPVDLYAQAKTLHRTATRAVDAGPKQLKRLDHGLQQAVRGIGSLREGLLRANNGSAALAAASARTFDGASTLSYGADRLTAGLGALESGIRHTTVGSERLASALSEVEAGTQRLSAASGEASAAASELDSASKVFAGKLDQGMAEMRELRALPAKIEVSLQQAEQALDATPDALKADQSFQAARNAVASALGYVTGSNGSAQQGSIDFAGMKTAVETAYVNGAFSAKAAQTLSESVSRLAVGLGKVRVGNQAVHGGAARTLAGSGKLRNALRQAVAGSARLRNGASKVRNGSDALADALGATSDGSRRLHDGLANGHVRSAGLSDGLKRATSEVSRFDRRVSSAVDKSGIDPKAATASGYLALAALQGVDSETKQAASFLVNADRGGDTARMWVMYKQNPLRDKTNHAQRSLDRISSDLGREIDADVRVGGWAAAAENHDSLTESRRLPMILAVALFALLILTVVFRSPVLATKAVLLNTLVIGAALGIMRLALEMGDAVVPNSGWMDSFAFFQAYAIAFMLSIDYEVFIIGRMREGYELTGTTEGAVRYGLDHTARVITGAAAVMLCVFVPFAFFGVAITRHQGLVNSAAILMDATVVRLVLLPAAMRLFGAANWWQPTWLERVLPSTG